MDHCLNLSQEDGAFAEIKDYIGQLIKQIGGLSVSVMKEAKKAEIQMHLTEFEMPPMQDVVIVGRNAPIGPEALKRMVDVLSPDQYKIIRVDHPVIEAIVVRNALMNMIPEEKLSKFILE